MIEVNGVKCWALIDTGSVVSSISETFYKQHCEHLPLQSVDSICDLKLIGATGTEIDVLGFIEVDVKLPALQDTMPVLMTIFRSSLLDNGAPALIGSNIIDGWKMSLREQYKSSGRLPSVNDIIDNWVLDGNKVGDVVIEHNVRMQPTGFSECALIDAKLTMQDVKPYERQVVFSPHAKYDKMAGIMLESQIINIPKRQQTMHLKIPAMNHQMYQKTLQCGTIGDLESVQSTFKPTAENLDNNDVTRDQFLAEFSGVRSQWSSEIKEKMDNLLWKHRKTFAMNSHELGCSSLEEHDIIMEGEQKEPVRERYRRIPPSMYQSVKEELEKMLKSKVIVPSSSPWCSPVTIAVKKNGTPRVCVDFRSLNLRTKKDAKTIPRVSDMLDTLNGKRVFSSLDMMSGFWQVKMAKRAQELTAFTAGPLGFYEFRRMPFGLCNSGATFQRMMEKVLKPLLHKIALVYIDDVIIYSTTEDEHIKHLDEVFATLSRFGLRLRPAKCKLLKDKLTFLGHQISVQGVTKDPEKVSAVRDYKTPTSVQELRRFLGTCGFMRRYLRNFAIIAKPLTDLLVGYSNKKKNRASNRKLEKQRWHWKGEHEEAFKQLKDAICEDVILKYPDFNQPFRIQTDASRTGLGAMLEQEEDGKWRPVAFASRKTSDTEKNYPTHKLEYLALKWAITEKFQDYVCAAPFTVYTDNAPLTHVWKSAKLDATGQRWLASLENFDFKVVYKPGATNTVADALSRQYEDTPSNASYKQWAKDRCVGYSEEQKQPSVSAVHKADKELLVDTEYDWTKLQESDDAIMNVKKAIDNDENPSESMIRKMPKFQRNLFQCFDKLCVYNNLLCYKSGESPRVLVVPESHHVVVAERYHSHGHFSNNKVKHLIERTCFWPTLTTIVKEVCNLCERCQKRKTPKYHTRVPLRPLRSQVGPMAQISMDFLNIDNRNEAKYKVLTVVDNFTKYGFAFDVKSENALNLAKLLYRHVYTKFGIPLVVHTDQGKSFLAKVVQELNKMLDIEHTTTTIYQPQSNGACERLNRTVIDRLGTLPPNQKQKWHEQLHGLMLVYNSTVHYSTGMSPFQAMFMRSPRIPVDCLLKIPQVNNDENVKSPQSYAESKMKELQEMYTQCAQNTLKSHKRNKKLYDKKCKGPRELQSGDKVLVRKHTPRNKIDDHYQAEIHVVIKKKHENSVVYCVKGLETSIVKYYHQDHLVLFRERDAKTKELKHVLDLPSWHDTRCIKSHEEPEFVRKESINKVVSITYGEANDLTADYTIDVPLRFTEKTIVNALKEANKTGATSAMLVLPKQQSVCSLFNEMLSGVRRSIESKKWDRIAIIISDSNIYNKMICVFSKYFPKTTVEATETEQWTAETDDELSEEPIAIPNIGQQLEEQQAEEEHSEEEQSEEEQSEEEQSEDEHSDDEQSDNEQSEVEDADNEEDEPVLRRSTRIRRQPDRYGDCVMCAHST